MKPPLKDTQSNIMDIVTSKLCTCRSIIFVQSNMARRYLKNISYRYKIYNVIGPAVQRVIQVTIELLT